MVGCEKARNFSKALAFFPEMVYNGSNQKKERTL